MKFNQCIFIALVLMLCISFSVQNSSRNKNKAKRSQSMMDYVNDFFSDDSAKSSKLRRAANSESYENHHHRNNKRYRFKQDPPIPGSNNSSNTTSSGNTGSPAQNASGSVSNSTAGNSTNSTVREILYTRPETPDPILGEYFMISSPAFRDVRKFPPIRMKDGSRIIIPVDDHDFRINDAVGKPDSTDKLPSDKFFWFRLSGLNIYYSASKTDVNILGAVSIESIHSVLSTGTDAATEFITTCFTVTDFSKTDWKICGLDEVVVKHWYCQIKAFLKEEDLIWCPVQDAETKVIEKIINITQPIIIIPIPTRKCNQNWNYQKDGDDWECDCSEGKEQAPIDLPKIQDAIDTSVRPLFQYERVTPGSTPETIDGIYTSSKSNVKLEFRENLLRAFHPKFGKVVTMDGAVYYAEEIVFHTPSEHTLEGKKYDMEVQIIHYGQTQGDIAKQIVLSFLFEKTPGAINPFLEDFNYFDLPNPTSTSREIDQNIFIPKILQTNYDYINPIDGKNNNVEKDSDFISMNPFSFFTYQGSITFPPCNEDTIMYVASEPLKIGTTALQLFQEALRIPDLMDGKGNVIVSDWIPKSARKTQPLNGRPVWHFDHTKFCAPEPRRREEPVGHYEKIRKAITNYFYVNTNEPSGIPNAYVVSEDEALGKGYGPKPHYRKGGDDDRRRRP